MRIVPTGLPFNKLASERGLDPDKMDYDTKQRLMAEASNIVKEQKKNPYAAAQNATLALPENTSAVNQPVKPSAETPSIKNWRGEEVKIPEGHIMSPRDPNFSEPPIIDDGPYTTAQRNQFLRGKSAGTKLSPHHRHQIPVRDGGVIDEIPGPGHPAGNQHTAGSPNRHPANSIFNAEADGDKLRRDEIKNHWKEKGKRLIEIEPGVWTDPGLP